MVASGTFDAACQSYLQFSRDEMRKFEKQFDAFDENSDGVIDFMELKRAQEKMGFTKTHTELKELMHSMATDPEKGITFSDFVKVQVKVQGLKSTPLVGGKIEVPPEISFVQACNDFSVKGIKSFMEAKAKADKEKIEQENKIKEAQEMRKNAKYRAQIEKEKEEKLKKEQEQKKAADKAAFQNKARAMFEGK